VDDALKRHARRPLQQRWHEEAVDDCGGSTCQRTDPELLPLSPPGGTPQDRSVCRSLSHRRRAREGGGKAFLKRPPVPDQKPLTSCKAFSGVPTPDFTCLKTLDLSQGGTYQGELIAPRAVLLHGLQVF